VERLRANIDKITQLDTKTYSDIRTKVVKHICHKDEFAKEMLTKSDLGKNNRFLNLMTDIALSVPNSHECVSDFKTLSFLLYDPQKILQNSEYKIKLQNLLVNELFYEPGHLPSIKGEGIK
jgi:hypothetical protein